MINLWVDINAFKEQGSWESHDKEIVCDLVEKLWFHTNLPFKQRTWQQTIIQLVKHSKSSIVAIWKLFINAPCPLTTSLSFDV